MIVFTYRVINNTVTGNCSSPQWQNGEEKKTMATYLQNNGYTTFYGGKYLNQVNNSDVKVSFNQFSLKLKTNFESQLSSMENKRQVEWSMYLQDTIVLWDSVG